MRKHTKRLNHCFCIAIGCGLLLASSVQAQVTQVIYSINPSTAFGTNGANGGLVGPTFTDNMDGTFSLANGTDSGINNAVFIESSDGGSVSTILGRALTTDDTVTVSGTVSAATVNYNANGVEFGLVSGAGFRAQPNLLLQIDADGARGGIASFYGALTALGNINRTQTPGAAEDSLNDGYSFEAVYSATDIVYTVTDIITENETGLEPVGATSITFSLTEAAAADPTLMGTLDDYVANYSTIVGDSFAYFSHQHTGGAGTSTLSNFDIEVTSDGVLLGDVDLNGVVNFLDIAPFINLLSMNGFQLEADIDGNGIVSFLDIAPFIQILAG